MSFSLKALKSKRKDRPQRETKTRKFTNHANTIHTKNVKVHYPNNDNALKNFIDKAKKEGKRLRVIGGGYSSAHTVMHEYEDGKVIVLSLKSYKTKVVSDFTLDIRDNIVTVNAGYTLGNVDNKIKECTKPTPNQRQTTSYELFTYPMNPEYTIGGCICTPAYGGNINEGLFYDSVVRMRVMNSDGNFQWIEGDDFLKFYKGSMGCFGIITHVALRIKEAKPTNCILSSLSVGLAPACVDVNKPDIAKNFLKKFLKNISQKSVHSLFVFDMYTNELSGYGWVEATGAKQVTKIHSKPVDSNGNEMLSPFSECILDQHNEGTPHLRVHKSHRDNKVHCNFRRCKAAMKALTSIHCWEIEQNIRQNVLTTNNYMWDVYHPHTLNMTYFIPVDKEFSSVYSALKIVSNATLKLTNESHYCPELPLLFQFVQSSKGIFSPIKDGQMYMAITLQTLTFTIKPEEQDHLSTAWRNYYCEIEEGFLNLNGIPDYSGVYGFSEPDEILNDDSIKDLLTSKEKRKVSMFLSQSDTNGVLQNMYMQQLTDQD